MTIIGNMKKAVKNSSKLLSIIGNFCCHLLSCIVILSHNMTIIFIYARKYYTRTKIIHTQKFQMQKILSIKSFVAIL